MPINANWPATAQQLNKDLPQADLMLAFLDVRQGDEMTNTARALFKFWRFFFSTQGRVSRVPYTLSVVLPRLVLVAAALATNAIVTPKDFQMSTMVRLADGGCFLLLLWPHFAITSKRLHDFGFSLWPALVLFMPFLTGIMLGVALANHMLNIFSTAGSPQSISLRYAHLILTGLTHITTVASLILALVPGTKGINRYGPNPLHPDGAVTNVF